MSVMADPLQTVGRRIVEEVDGAGITVADLTSATGLGRAALAARLRCEVPWTLEEIDAIAPLLGTTSSTLIAEARVQSPRD